MTMAYNIHATHRLEPISGYDEITHLQFTAPMNATALTENNGSGEEPGLPAGSCVSLNADGQLIAGAEGNAMPMFLLWSSSDPDGMPGAFTANGQNIAGISMNGATFAPNGDALTENSELTRNLYTYTVDGNGNTTAFGATSGTASSLQRIVNGNTVSYQLRNSAGNFTTWPATCGLEITTTEFDFSIPETDFAPNTLLTSPKRTGVEAFPQGYTGSDIRVKYQQARGGYITVLDPTDDTPVSGTTTVPGDNGGADTTVDVNYPYHNVCGTVSRGVHTNENAVKVLYFWAERTLLPKAS